MFSDGSPIQSAGGREQLSFQGREAKRLVSASTSANTQTHAWRQTEQSQRGERRAPNCRFPLVSFSIWRKSKRRASRAFRARLMSKVLFLKKPKSSRGFLGYCCLFRGSLPPGDVGCLVKVMEGRCLCAALDCPDAPSGLPSAPPSNLCSNWCCPMGI